MARLEVMSSAASRSFVGRCVDWQTRAPVAGCRIQAGDCITASDADGRFELRVPDHDAGLPVTVTAPHRVGVTRRVMMPSHTFELHDVALRRAGNVCGLLADDKGQPCANRVVAVVPANHVLRDDGWQELVQQQLRTRADGSFRFAVPIAAGAMQVRVPEVPALLGDENHVVLPGDELFLSLRCRSWQACDELCGVVRDDTGQPVVGALLEVLATHITDAPVLQAGHSDSLGRFCLIRADASVDRVWLRATLVDGRLESTLGGPYGWGDCGLHIELSRADGLWLHVVDAATGVPIERFAVQHVRTSGVRSALAGARSHDGIHASGRCWLEQVGIGSLEVIVWPADARWLPNLPHAFTVEAGDREVRIALARATELPVTVLTTTGRPVAGAAVQLLLPSDNRVVRDLSCMLQHGGSRVQPNVRVMTARTDQDGVAVLRWLASDRPLQLRIAGTGIAPHTEHGVRLTAHGVTVHVADSGTLQATLQRAAGMRLELIREDRSMRLPKDWSAPLQLDGLGQLTVDLPAGDWLVRLATPVSNGTWRTLPDDIARVSIQPGRRTQLQRSVEKYLAPAECTGRAFVDGQPAPHVALLHGVERHDGGVRVVDVSVLAPNRHGEFRFPALRAGYYRVELRMTCCDQQITVSRQDWRRVSGGQHVDWRTLSVATATLTIALRDTSQAAVTTGLLLLRGANGAVLTGTPDARGLVTFARIPISSYELQLRRSGRSLQLGQVAAGGDATEPQLFIVR